jgi:hypothetical protein
MADPRNLMKKEQTPINEPEQSINWKEAKLDLTREDLEKVWSDTYKVAMQVVINRTVVDTSANMEYLISSYMPRVFKACDLVMEEYTKYLKQNRPMVLDCLEIYNRIDEPTT